MIKSLNYFSQTKLSPPSPSDGNGKFKRGVLTVPQLVNLHLDRQFRRHSEGGSYLVIPAKLGNRR